MIALTQQAIFEVDIIEKYKFSNQVEGGFTFIDLYSGIGGFRIPLEEAGGICIGFSEIDKTAVEVYRNNFDTSNEIEFGDITKFKNIPKVDIVTGGVPCQSWSVAGKMKGFDDPRGALWFDTIKFVEKSEPKAFIFENVKGLADPRNRESLSLIIRSFEDLGYVVKYKVLNAFDFGLPQSRERIFIVGVKNNITQDFEFPDKSMFLPRLATIFEVESNLFHGKVKNTLNIKNSFNISYQVNNDNFFTFCDTRNGKHSIHSWDLMECSDTEKEICMALLKNRRKKSYGQKDGNPLSLEDLNILIGGVREEDLYSLIQKKILLKKGLKYDFVNSKNSSGINGIYRVFLPSSHVFSTLTKTGVRDLVATVDIPQNITDKKQYFLENIYKKQLIRKLTTLEAARIQGFPDGFKFTKSDTKNFSLLGNALGVNIVRNIVKNLVPTIIN
jgi:DNA (cytosine-5)-methyltransferase 1